MTALLVLVGAIVVGIPLLVIAWALLLLISAEFAMLAVVTVCLVPVLGWPVTAFNVLVAAAIRGYYTLPRHDPYRRATRKNG
jgi:hypothetical protein